MRERSTKYGPAPASDKKALCRPRRDPASPYRARRDLGGDRPPAARQDRHAISRPLYPGKVEWDNRLILNLRMDPFERAHHESMLYDKWGIDRIFVLVPAQTYVGQFLSTFREFPPRQKRSSFTIDQVMESMSKARTN